MADNKPDKSEKPEKAPKVRCTAACWGVKLICTKTLHRHTAACNDAKGNRKCGMFDHPQHDLWNECGKSVKTCSH